MINKLSLTNKLNCFWFLQADEADDVLGFGHRYGMLDANQLTSRSDRYGELLDNARAVASDVVPTLEELQAVVVRRVADVKCALDAMPASKQIRDELAAMTGDDRDFLKKVAAMRRADESATPLLCDMREYVAGAAQYLLKTDVQVPPTKKLLQMWCFMLVSRLSVCDAVFDANEIDEAASAALSMGEAPPSHGDAVSAEPDVSLTCAIEEWKQHNASKVAIDGDRRKLITIALTRIKTAVKESADTAAVLLFTTMQVGFARTTHVTAVHARGGLVRFQLCHFADIRERSRDKFIALVLSICQIHEYNCTKDDATLKALFTSAVRESVAAPAASASSNDVLKPRPLLAALPERISDAEQSADSAAR